MSGYDMPGTQQHFDVPQSTGQWPPQYDQGASQMHQVGGTQMGHGDTHGGGGHGDHGDHGHGGHRTINKETGESPRRCTDLGCCVCWLVMMIGMTTLLVNAYIHGNYGRLTNGVDYYGRTCGHDAGVENKPFLYWCRELMQTAGQFQVTGNTGNEPKTLDLDNPICIETCPINDQMLYNCIAPTINSSRYIGGGQLGNVKTQVIMIRESKVKVNSYPTRIRGGRYCMPMDETLREQVISPWGRALGPFSPRRILVAIGTIYNCWWLFFLVFILSIFLGYGYLYAIKFCPKYVVMIAAGLPMVWFFVLAFGFSFFWWPWLWPGEDNYVAESIIMKHNPLYRMYDVQWASIISLVLALFCWLAFLFFLLIMMKFDGAVISDLVHAVFECFRTDNGMFAQPILEGILKFIVFGYGVQGLQLVAAEGWITKNNIEINGARFAGLSRDYTPSVEDGRFYGYLFLWIGFWFWSMEMCNAFGQFVTSYEVFAYYSIPLEGKRKPKHKICPLLKGIKYGMIYHWGSVAKGAIKIPLSRPARFCYWATATLFDPVQTNHSPCPCFPVCCLTCLQKVVSILCCFGCGKCAEGGCEKQVRDNSAPNKDGFHDVVIRSNDWDPAVLKGHELLEHSHPIVKNLYQKLDQMTINVIGILAIPSLNALMMYLFVTELDEYKKPERSNYVADPILVTFLAWILSAYITFGFMTLWDHTCDGLLYCYAWSRKWNRATVSNYIPETLRYIVGFDDVENDRYPYYGRAKNNMYLRSWLPMVGVDEKKKKPVTKSQGRTQMSEPPESYMSGFGTGFGAWGRQENAVSGDFQQSPLLGH
jgi:hypothetical protein